MKVVMIGTRPFSFSLKEPPRLRRQMLTWFFRKHRHFAAHLCFPKSMYSRKRKPFSMLPPFYVPP